MVDQQHPGHTPLFELPGDPLAQASTNVPPPQQQRAALASSAPNDISLANNAANRKTAPTPIATNRVASPISLFSPTSEHAPGARTSVSGSVGAAGSIAARRRREEEIKRPTSPHITQPSIRHSISGRRPEGISSPGPHRQSSLGRSEGYGVVFEAEEDDEADKGHRHAGVRSASPAPLRTDSPRRRGSGMDDDGRKTPAAYRPPTRTTSRTGSRADFHVIHSPYHAHPLARSHGASDSVSSTSSAKTHLNTPPQPPPGASGSSPMQRPQARRGAVRLQRPKRRMRRKAGQPSMLVRLGCYAKTAVWAVSHPSDAWQAGHEDLRARLKAVDAAFRDPQGKRTLRPEWIGAYIPLLIWLVVSLSSTFTVLIWHTKVFRALDQLARTLQGLGLSGRVILGALIFLTTFPPLPLYSTLIVISGFSFGLVQGFIISYIAALAGAITVFCLSRTFLKSWMVGLLNKSGGLRKVVRAIEKQPKLLFLVRLAPYPYNLMNTLLASSPTLTLRTYTLCTAVALPKLLVHTGLGTTIKNFAAYNGAGTAAAPSTNETALAANGTAIAGGGTNLTSVTNSTSNAATGASHTAETIKHVAGFVGVGLCIGIFFYLFSVASAAVDELDDEVDGAPLRAAGEYDVLAMEDEDELDYYDEEGNDEPKKSVDDADVDEQPLDTVAVTLDGHLPMSELHNSDASPWLQRPSAHAPARQPIARGAGEVGHIASNSSASTLISDLEASSDGQSSDALVSSSSQPHHKLEYASYGVPNQLASQISLADSIGAFEDHADEAFKHSQHRHEAPKSEALPESRGSQSRYASYRDRGQRGSGLGIEELGYASMR